MNRRASITLIAGVLVFSVVALIAGSGKSYAQSDMDDVKAAVAAYHAALNALDAPKMEALWVQDDSVMDIEPSDKSISVGWAAVKKNFESVLVANDMSGFRST